MLRRELTQQHSEDKKAALTQLTFLKEQEMEAARSGWEAKIRELHDQVKFGHCGSKRPTQL